MGDCRICRDIPDRIEYISLACEPLRRLRGGEEDLWKCPLCGSYYEYSYWHSPGAPEYTVDPVTDESVTRITPLEAIDWICRAQSEPPFDPMPIVEAELEQLLVEHPVPEEPTETLVALLDAATHGVATARRAAWWLGRRRVGQAIPALEQLLASEAGVQHGITIDRDRLHAHAARALGAMGAAGAPALIAQLAGKPAAAYGLGHLVRVDPTPTTVASVQPVLLARLAALGDSIGTSYPAYQEAAAIVWAIGMAGFSEVALAALVDVSGRALMREPVIRAFARMGAAVVPALLGMLDGDECARDLAVRSLTELGPEAREALPVLTAHPAAASVAFVQARAAITAPGPDPKTGASRS